MPFLLLLILLLVLLLLQVSRNLRGVYRYGMLAVWLGCSSVMILDRFYWNIWPRQSICTDGCGTDIFCDMDEVLVADVLDQLVRHEMCLTLGGGRRGGR